MQNDNLYTIHGVIRTVTPLHIASPVSCRYDPKLDVVLYNAKETIGSPITVVETLGFPGCGENGKTVYLPTISGNTIAGLLRRQAALMIAKHFIDSGSELTVGGYLALQCGAASGSPDGGLITFDHFKAMKEHLYLGTFGGGPKLMRRHLRTHNLVPMTANTVNAGIRFDHPFGYEAPQYLPSALTAQVMQNRVNDLERNIRPEVASALINYDKVITVANITPTGRIRKEKEEKKIEGENETPVAEQAKPAEAKEEKAKLANWSGHQFVPPNIEFPFKFQLLGDISKLGLVLKSMEQLALDGSIGGRGRNGYGRIQLEQVAVTGVDPITRESSFSPIQDIFINNRLMDSDSDYITSSVEAFDNALKALTADAFEELLFGKAA